MRSRGDRKLFAAAGVYRVGGDLTRLIGDISIPTTHRDKESLP